MTDLQEKPEQCASCGEKTSNTSDGWYWVRFEMEGRTHRVLLCPRCVDQARTGDATDQEVP